MILAIKRIYEEASKEDGYRILVDRLWPRGISKERAKLYKWAKEISPSSELRKEFGHKEDNFGLFVKEYNRELNNNPETKVFIEEIKKLLAGDNITLLYAAKDQKINHAAVLKNYLSKKIK